MNAHQLSHSIRNSSIALMITALILTPLPTQRAQAAGVVGNGTPGSCTEAALNVALAGGGLVNFNCGVSAKTITITSTKTIIADTTIQGGNLITLSGGNAKRVFQVNSSAALTLQDLTVANGKDYYGGGLSNLGGTVNLIHSTFTGNTADCTGAGSCEANGGAIYNVHNGILNIADSDFSNNSGIPAVFQANGGAIYNFDGTVTITHSLFSGNYSQMGGAIYNYDGTVQVTGVSTFTLNVATQAGSPNGGAISNNNTLIVGDTTFDRNRASSTGGSFAYGGAIYSSDTLTVKDSTFTGNYAASAGGLGGAIWADYQSKITGSGFSENYTGGNSSGGTAYFSTGTHRMEDSTINGRSGGLESAINGGAIFNNETTLTIINTTISDSYSQSGSGIYNNTPGTLYISRSNFNRNHSIMGGGLYNLGRAEVTDSSFNANTAASTSYTSGGGIYNSGTLTLTLTTFDQNSTTSSGAFGAYGGGVYSQNTSNIVYCTFSQNSVNTAGGTEVGSAIYASEAMTITGSSFIENEANDGDGTIYLDSGSFTVSNSTFYSNSVSTDGSALLNYDDGDLTIQNSTIAHNSGVAISEGPSFAGAITFTNSILANNGTNCMIGYSPVNNGGNLQYGGSISNSCGVTIPTLNPLLDPLTDYGGPTLTMRLHVGSNAIDHATANCPNLDQRGFTRSDPPCDSGAYEVSGTATSLASSRNPSLPRQHVTFTATVEESDSPPLPTGTITFKDNGVVLDTVTVDSTGKATYTTLFPENGDHSITAEYSGDVNFNPSASPVLTQMVSGILCFFTWVTKK